MVGGDGGAPVLIPLGQEIHCGGLGWDLTGWPPLRPEQRLPGLVSVRVRAGLLDGTEHRLWSQVALAGIPIL